MRLQSHVQGAAPETDPLAQIFLGTPGGDWIVGTSGDDVITGGGGADALAGGAGRDTFVYLTAGDSNASAYDNLYDFQSGEDRIDLTALLPTSVSIVRQGGSSFLFANTPTGALQIVGAARDFNGSDLILPGGMGIFLDNRGSGATLIGTAGNDNIRGGAGQDYIVGGVGADYLFGGLGVDTFAYLTDQDSTPGAYDTIAGFASWFDRIDLTALGLHDVGVVASAGSDGVASFIFGTTASGAAFQLRVNAILNQNGISGAPGGRDLVIGDQGVTIISSVNVTYGTTGSDVIYSDANYGSASTIFGGGGADRIVLRGGASVIDYRLASDSPIGGADTIFGFVSGRDRVTLSGFSGVNDKWSYGIAHQGNDSFLFIDLGVDGSFDMLIQFNNVYLKSGDIAEYSFFNSAPLETPLSPDVLPPADPVKLDPGTRLDLAHHDGWLTLV